MTLQATILQATEYGLPSHPMFAFRGWGRSRVDLGCRILCVTADMVELD